MADVRLGPVGADLGEPGVPVDLDPPPLVLGQVPVKRVHLVEGQQVEILLDELHRKQMASHIQVHAPIGEAGRVFDPDRG